MNATQPQPQVQFKDLIVTSGDISQSPEKSKPPTADKILKTPKSRISLDNVV